MVPAPGWHGFGEKMLSAMRFHFGGHIEGHEPVDRAGSGATAVPIGPPQQQGAA